VVDVVVDMADDVTDDTADTTGAACATQTTVTAESTGTAKTT
jgi:hypothetical protein